MANQRYPLPVPNCAIYSPKRLYHRTATRALEDATGYGTHQGGFECPCFSGSNRNLKPHILKLQNDTWIFPDNVLAPACLVKRMSSHQIEVASVDCMNLRMTAEQNGLDTSEKY
jgi:hypothetical protein